MSGNEAAAYSEDLPLRQIKYGHIKKKKINKSDRYPSTIATIIKHSKPVYVRLWQGLVTENLAQGLARDVFADSLVRLEKSGRKILFHVHDEVIIEADEEGADKTLEEVIKIMSTPPDWIPDIPLAAEGSVLEHYEK